MKLKQMNEIKLNGYLKNIQPSHTIGNVYYDRADLVVPRPNGKEDIVRLVFKRYSNTYNEDDFISLTGNVRSYSAKDDNDRNKVSIYVFTYFDVPEERIDDDKHIDYVIDGRICKIDPIRTTSNDRMNIHFILANNLIVSDGDRKLNAYLPCIAWGSLAKRISNLKVSDKITIRGRIHSREYVHNDDNGETEIKVAHELLVTDFEINE